MHYFIALDFDKSTREQFLIYAKSLQNQAEKARIVKEDHVHLTLSFLGELSEEQVENAKAIVKNLDQDPLDLTFNRISRFTPSRGGAIVWIGPEEHPQLSTLYSELKSTLKRKGFKVDERPFTPHVTLARGVKITEEDDSRFKAAFKPFKTTVRSMSLLCSKFEEGRLVYKTIIKKEFDAS